MILFMETESGGMQNLLLLQDVVARESEVNPGKFALAYVQENGEFVEDKFFDTMAAAETAAEDIRQDLLNTY